MMQILIVVPVALKSAAESIVFQIDELSRGETFTIRLSRTGVEPATHVACQPNVSSAVAEQIALIANRTEFTGSSVFVASSDADHLPMIARSLDFLNLLICE